MSYTVLGTNNMQAAVEFYNALFDHTTPYQTSQTERMTFWLFEDFAFAIAIPFDKEPASNGNGTMIGFNVESREEVIRLHQKAIDLGGTCEGEPHEKGIHYSAYVRDLDNNKLCFFES